ncbi:MAG: hypothetical protein ACO3U1_03990 [Marivivens sp.]
MTSIANRSEAPHYRGYFSLFGTKNGQTELDRASKRILPFRFREAPRFWFSIVSVYGARENTRVILETENKVVQFQKVYALGRFPFVSKSANKNSAYKSLHFAFGLTRFGVHNRVKIIYPRTVAESQTNVLELVSVAETAYIEKFEETLSQIDDLLENPNPDIDVIATLFVRLGLYEDRPGAQIEILKAKVILDVCATSNHKRAFRNLEVLSGLLDEADFSLFSRKLAKISSPLALGRHGYYPSFADLDLNKVEAQLTRLISDIEKCGVEVFINSGTLLGYIRDGRPIVRDDDFDLASIIPGSTFEEICENWRDFKSAISEEYAIIDKGSFIAIRLEIGIQVDIFSAWILSGKLFVYPYCYGDCLSDVAVPVRRFSVRSSELPIPNNPDVLLDVNYAGNWRSPDPYWRFNWNRANKRFKKELRSLKGR